MIEDITFYCFVYVLVTGMACLVAYAMLEIEETKSNWTMLAVWPLTLLILSPVLLVKLFAVTFKKRGLVSAYATGVANVYKKAVQ